MCGIACLMARKGPIKLMRRISCQCSAVCSASGTNPPKTPALARGIHDDLKLRMDCQLHVAFLGWRVCRRAGRCKSCDWSLPRSIRRPTRSHDRRMLAGRFAVEPQVQQQQAGTRCRRSRNHCRGAGRCIANSCDGTWRPIRLRDVGITRTQFDDIAAKSFNDPPMRTNPRPIFGGAGN